MVRRLHLAAAGAAVTVATACGARYGAPRPASAEARHVLDLWMFLMPLAIGVGAVVLGLIGWSVVRYRRRGDDLPPQFQYHVPIEVLYTAVPVVIVAVIFAVSLGVQRRVTAVSATPANRVEVIGFRWQWQFRYVPSGAVVTGTPDHPPELVLPVGQISRLHLVSTDVDHSFFVPAFLEKRDLIPGVDNTIDVTPTRPGSFDGHCAEYCGLYHDRMTFTVRVVPPDQFHDWLAAQPRGPAPTAPPAP
jgi:cytochrome c oxidase subunit 2